MRLQFPKSPVNMIDYLKHPLVGGGRVKLDKCPVCNGTAFGVDEPKCCLNCGFNKNDSRSVAVIRKRYCKKYLCSKDKWAAMLGYSKETVRNIEKGRPTMPFIEKVSEIVYGKL